MTPLLSERLREYFFKGINGAGFRVKEYESLVSEVEALEAKLQYAEDETDNLRCAVGNAMVKFHCDTFGDQEKYGGFPNKVQCGTPKKRTCSRYYFCEAIHTAIFGEAALGEET